jgi:hypothetical protein
MFQGEATNGTTSSEIRKAIFRTKPFENSYEL